MAGKLKVAIVTDWLTNMGGAERVVLEVHKMFPSAPIYTSLFNADKMPLFNQADVRTSFIQKIPYAVKKHQLFPLLREYYFSRLNLSDYDLVISIGGAEAKSAMMHYKRPKESLKTKLTGSAPDGSHKNKQMPLHINYCHSPTHYYWVRPDEYLENPGFGWFNPVMRLGLKTLLKRRRVWDYLAAQNPDVIIANSTITKERIRKFYDRTADAIVFPPVDVDRFKIKGEAPHRRGFVALGRQVHYKGIDLAVMACTRLELPLKVIGVGPEHDKLVELAGPSIEFLTNVTDDEMSYHLHAAEGFIFPGVEDFGIVAVEAMSAGTPVIALRDGGALDTVDAGRSGVFFDRQNVRALTKVLREFDVTKFSHAGISAHARKFATANFKKDLLITIKQALNSK